MTLLAGKVAVVTGAGRGIGRAVAKAFASEGAAVAVAARSSGEINRVSAEIQNQGGLAISVRTDITLDNDVDSLFGQVRSDLGEVDILVNNAGCLGPMGRVWETEPADWLATFDVNVTGMVRCLRAVLPAMSDRGFGKIINVGSDAGWSDYWAATNSEHTAYAASKAAVRRMSSVVAEQVKSLGVNVNCLGVSADTRMSMEARRQLGILRAEAPPGSDEISVETGISAEENVDAFLFLASSLSDHITGQYIEANSLRTSMRNIASDREGR